MAGSDAGELGRDHVPTAIVCADDGDLSRAIARVLVVRGYATVAWARRGIEGVEAAARWQPDVAVVDVAVAGLLGVRVIGAIRVAAPRTEVIAVVPGPALRDDALEAGATLVMEASDLRSLPVELDRVTARLQLP